MSSWPSASCNYVNILCVITITKPIGRPKLPAGAAKETKLQVRLLRSEEEEIEAAAQKAGKTKSHWVRAILLDAARGRLTRRAKRASNPMVVEETLPEPSEDEQVPEQPFTWDLSGNQEFLD